jgi:hypothetical protein
MADDAPILEPIGRRGPPLIWVGGLAAVLVAVVAIAIGGRLEPRPSASGTQRGEAGVHSVAVSSGPVSSAAPLAPGPVDSAAAAPAASLATTAPATSPLHSPAPIWYRPSPWPMGEDGLAGGTVYSSPSPSPESSSAPDPGDFGVSGHRWPWTGNPAE